MIVPAGSGHHCRPRRWLIPLTVVMIIGCHTTRYLMASNNCEKSTSCFSSDHGFGNSFLRSTCAMRSVAQGAGTGTNT